jgi:hypothetical protein
VRIYHVADQTLTTTFALPALEAAPRARAPWTLTIERRRRPPAADLWYHESFNEETRRPWRRMGFAGSHDIVRYQDHGSFVIDRAKRRLTGYPHADLDREALCQVIIGHVLPLILSLSGRLVLHASASRVDGGVVAFVGPSGSGKSTLAAALAVRGRPLMADDCVALRHSGRRWLASPFQSGLRLWRDAGEALVPTAPASVRRHPRRKWRLDARKLGLASPRRAGQLRRLYLLDARETPSGVRGAVRLSTVAPADAMVTLIRAGFHPALEDGGAMRRLFEQLTTLVSTVDIRRLRYPQQLDALDRVTDAVLRDCAM